MAIKVEVEGVGPLEFEDGTPPEVIQRTVKRLVGERVGNTPTTGQSFTRGLGLGARDAIEGFGILPGMVVDAVNTPVNLGIRGINAVAGTEIPQIPPMRETLSGAGDAMGLPKPVTSGEKLTSAVGQNVAGLLPSMGVGAALGPTIKAAAAPTDSLIARLLGNTTGPVRVTSQAGPQATFIGNALTTAPAAQLTGAAGAGYAGEAAKQAQWGPAQQFGASLAGGIAGASLPGMLMAGGRGVASFVQPFRQAGREKIVGEALLRNSTDPETLAQRLREGADDTGRRLPGSPVTSAVAARDPQMMLLESGMRSDVQTVPGAMSPAAALRDVDAQRNVVRTQTIEALQRGGLANPTARGDAVRTGLEGAETAMRARTNQLFDVARSSNSRRVPVGNILERASEPLSVFSPQRGGAGVPAELQSILDDIGNLRLLDIDQAQNIRARLGDVAGNASVAGNTQLARAAGAVQEAIESEMADPKWMAAVAQRRAQGQALGRDMAGSAASGAIMRADKYGAAMRTSDDAIKEALKSPQSAKQVLEAGYKALDDARRAGLPTDELSASVKTMRQALRDQFADNMAGASRTTSDIADAAGNVSRQLSPAQFTRWWEKNQRIADVLFDGAERRTLDRLAADFAETSTLNTARARGSDTAQNLSVGNFIARLTNGVVDPQNPLAQSIGNLGPIARWIVSSPEQAMREMMVQALRDPKFAAQLTQKAGPDSLERAMLYWQKTMPQRVQDAALEALAREVPRIGLEMPTGPQGPMPRLPGR